MVNEKNINESKEVKNIDNKKERDGEDEGKKMKKKLKDNNSNRIGKSLKSVSGVGMSLIFIYTLLTTLVKAVSLDVIKDLTGNIYTFIKDDIGIFLVIAFFVFSILSICINFCRIKGLQIKKIVIFLMLLFITVLFGLIFYLSGCMTAIIFFVFGVLYWIGNKINLDNYNNINKSAKKELKEKLKKIEQDGVSKDCDIKPIYIKIILFSMLVVVIDYFLLQDKEFSENILMYYITYVVSVFIIIGVIEYNLAKLSATEDELVKKLNQSGYMVAFKDYDYGKYKVDENKWLSFYDLCKKWIDKLPKKLDTKTNKFIINYLNLIKNKLIDYKLYFQFNAVFVLGFKLLFVLLILVCLFFLKFSGDIKLFMIIFVSILSIIYISGVNVSNMVKYSPFSLLVYGLLLLFQIILSVTAGYKIIETEKISNLNYLNLKITNSSISKSNTGNNYNTIITGGLGVLTDFKGDLTFNQVKDLLNSNFVLSNFIVFNIFYYSIVLLFISWFFIILKDISRYNKNFIMLGDKLTKIKILEENIENRLKNGRFIGKYLLNEEKILKEELDKLGLTMRELLPEVGDIHLDDELYKKMLENYKINFKS